MPIVMSKEEWARIVKWTDPNKEDPAAVRRRERVQQMDQISREMTKEWPNSLENVNKRNEEMRRARQEAAEQANSRFYQRYVRRKQQQQAQLMHSARDTIFKNKDAPKLLMSAVIESAVQKELIVQREFNQKLRDKAAAQKKQEDDRIIRQAMEWHELQAQREKKRREVNKENQREILEQAREQAERNRKEYEKELNCQKIDNMRANEEMQLIKEYEEKLKAEEKKRIFSSMEQAHSELMARRRENEARDKMDDRLIEVLTRSKCRVEQMRRDTERRIKDEKLRVLEEISKGLVSTDADRAAKEQASHDKAVQEKLEAELAREKADAAKVAAQIADKKEQRRLFLEEEERRAHEMNTMKQWQMINRFKNSEIYEDYLQQQRDEKARKTQEYRQEILRLWKEREDRSAREKAETRQFYGPDAEQKLRLADNKLLTYADQLIQEAVEKQRPPYPIYKAIERYCKMYRLYPMPELYASLQEHFQSYRPRDGTRPDAGYSEPPPPPPHRDQHRDGLQAAASPPRAAPPPRPAPPPLRAAPANGLQQRIELVLPPVPLSPCHVVQATPYVQVKPEQCRCIDDGDKLPATVK